MPDEQEGETTVLSGATTNSKSLRATVPIGIVRQFGLKEGDHLEWKLEARNNELVIVAIFYSCGSYNTGYTARKGFAICVSRIFVYVYQSSSKMV